MQVSPRPLSKVVGRERELAALVGAVTNPPALVFVEGELGVGKTALVSAMRGHEALTDVQVLVGDCHALVEPSPFGPVIEAVRGLESQRVRRSLSPVTGALRPLVPELATILPPQPDALDDAHAERHRTLRALRELVDAPGATVLVLEDVHWADPSTLEFLWTLLSDPPPRTAVVLTYRRDAVEPASPLLGLAERLPAEAERVWIDVPPLDATDVRKLVAARLRMDAERIPQHFATALHSRTGGLPLAVEETVRLLGQGAAVGTPEAAWPGDHELRESGIPRGFRDAVEQRLDALSHDARCLVEAGAVLDMPFTEELLRRVSAIPPARARRGLTEALQSLLLHEPGEGLYAPRHPLAADAIRDTISTPKRRFLHARAAAGLKSADGPEPFAQLAYHFKHAAKTSQWVRYAELAADAAAAAGDHLAATRLLHEVLNGPALPHATKTRLAVKLGSAAFHGLAPSESIETLRHVLHEQTLQAGVRGELRLALARLLVQAGETTVAEDELRCTVTELRRRPGLAVYAMAHLASPWSPRGTEGEHRDWLEQALGAAERQESREVARLARSTRATTLLALGDPAGWEAVEVVSSEEEHVGDRLVTLRCVQLAVATFHIGHYPSARGFLDRAEEGCGSLTQSRWMPMLETVALLLDWATGSWEGLEVRTRQQLQTVPEVPTALLLGTRRVLANFLLHRGDVAGAEQSLKAVMDIAAENSLPGFVGAASQLALMRLACGDSEGAWQAAAPGIAALRAKEVWVWAGELVPVATEVLIARGRHEDAHDLVAEFAEGLRHRDAPAANAAHLSCRAILMQGDGRHGAASECFAQAAEAWNALPRPYEAARAREHQGQSLLRQGDQGGSRALEDALMTYHDLGAAWDVERLRALFRGHRLALPYPIRGGRRAYGEMLSPRERAVARSAGMGRTNREIAEELFLSPRTVEDHLAAARRKLGVQSREAFIPALDELDGLEGIDGPETH